MRNREHVFVHAQVRACTGTCMGILFLKGFLYFFISTYNLNSYIQYKVIVTCPIFTISHFCDLICVFRWCSENLNHKFLFHCKNSCNRYEIWIYILVFFHCQISLTETFGKVNYSILWLSLHSYTDFYVVLSTAFSRSCFIPSQYILVRFQFCLCN